jgi:hypothetical protein
MKQVAEASEAAAEERFPPILPLLFVGSGGISPSSASATPAARCAQHSA